MAKLLRSDVEGTEYELLPSLIISETICMFDYMYIEWHVLSPENSNEITNTSGRNGKPQAIAFQNSVINFFTGTFPTLLSETCPTIMTTMDDETSLHDGQELPTRLLC